MNLARVVSWLLAFAWCVGAAGNARAFCRTTTAKNRGDACAGECETTGYPLAWPEPAISYVFHEDGFPDLDDATLRQVFRDAFQQWADLSCGGEPVGLEIDAEAETTTLGPRPEKEAATTNVVGHLSAQEWYDADFEPLAFALTRVRFHPPSGRIVGADTWYNGGAGAFGACEEEGCSEGVIDLPNVATHEAGHFLGLDHSGVRGATMACGADAADVDKRTLEKDDRAGMCAIYPPDLAFSSAYLEGKWAARSHRKRSAACSVGAARGSDSDLSWACWILLLTATLLRGRRKSEV